MTKYSIFHKNDYTYYLLSSNMVSVSRTARKTIQTIIVDNFLKNYNQLNFIGSFVGFHAAIPTIKLQTLRHNNTC